MILASIRDLIFIENPNIHTISYSKHCKDLCYASGTWVNAVIAETNEQAVCMLREEIQKYLYKGLKEGSYVVDYKDFNFQVHTSDVVDGKVSIRFWDWDKKTYSAEA